MVESTTKFFAIKRRVTIDGVDITHLADIVVDEAIKETTILQVNDHNYSVEVELGTYMATGSVAVWGKDSVYGNDPMPLIDFVSLISGFGQYDTTNDVVKYTYDSQSAYATGVYGPKRLIEVRQTEGTADDLIDDDPNEEALAQQFIAAGEDINLIRLLLREPIGTDLNTFDLEIWTDDGSDAPNAKVASTNTVTVNCSGGVDDETNAYIGALTEGADYTSATWETIDMSADTPDILDGESLTLGDLYWLVIRNTTAAGEDLGVSYTTRTNTLNGIALGDDDVTNSPAWGDGPANITHLAYVIQFEAAAGHQIKIYDYKDSTSGYVWTYSGVRFSPSSSVAFSPKTVVKATLKWSAQDVDGPTAF
jgi:hypothetical protein